MTKDEIPVDIMWCGKLIPKVGDTNIFSYLSDRKGRDILKVQESAMFLFELTEAEFDYWLGEWRFTVRS